MKFNETPAKGATVSLTSLKAEAAMRHVDWLIAKKHERQAEDHVAANDSPANQKALRGARAWTANRKAAYREALAAWNAAAAL